MKLGVTRPACTTSRLPRRSQPLRTLAWKAPKSIPAASCRRCMCPSTICAPASKPVWITWDCRSGWSDPDRAQLQRQPARPEVGPQQAQDIFDSIEVAALLGVKRVVTMSGTPTASPSGTAPVWNVMPWHSAYLDVQHYQWNEVTVPFWKRVQARASDAAVKVCIEMHPHNIVYNPATVLRLATEINATHVGAELDPSHLFWQGIEPIEAANHLGDLVYNAAAKDTRINAAARINGDSTTGSVGSRLTRKAP
jgi:sugar phosphate isomerase/epimerase